jgi:hypothetical protein
MQDMPYKIADLDASPSVDAVSKVAQGGTPVNQQEDEEQKQHKPGEMIGECEDGCCQPNPHEMMEAFAKIFEGLGSLFRSSTDNS